MSIIICLEETKEKTATGTGRRINIWGHVEGIMSRKDLKEKKPLPSSVGQAERSPRVGMSDSQNNNISQKCYQQVCLRLNCTLWWLKYESFLGCSSIIRNNMWILERRELDDCDCFDTFCINIFFKNNLLTF